MKTIMKEAIRDQKGAALPLVLVLLVVGGLILTPLLGLMSTGLVSGQVYEKKTDELYAADAGVEDAIWRIQGNNLEFDANNNSHLEPLAVNDKSVDVVVHRYDWDWTCGENLTYQIFSTATSQDGSSTTIESYVDAEIVVRNLLDNAITSLKDVELGSGSTVYGDVQYGVGIKGETEGINSTKEVYEKWPSPSRLSNLYLGQVDPNNPCDNSIKLAGETKPIGPCYINGDLTVDNTAMSQSALMLTGTIYVTGNAQFAQSGDKKGYTVKLNGNTIFVLGDIRFPTARVTVEGPGCIIAIGNINFQPSISGSRDFVFVLSVDGSVNFKPSGTFYGSVAGNEMVNLQPNCGLGWLPWQGSNLNFPIKDYAYPTGIVETVTIRTWEVINPQQES